MYDPTMDTTQTTFEPGQYALWHRSRQGLPPRSVMIWKQLGTKLRVADMVDTTVRNIVFRDVFPANLTPTDKPKAR